MGNTFRALASASRRGMAAVNGRKRLFRLMKKRLARFGRAERDYEAIKAGEWRSFFRQTEGMISREEAELLYELARAVTTGCIVEVGSYRGRSTVALARGSLDGARVPVYAIEPHEPFVGVLGGRFGPADRGAFFQAMLDSSAYHVVRLVNLSSEAVTATWSLPVALLWLDGDHSYDGVSRDFRCWQPHLLPTAAIAFDDATDPTLGPYRLISELTAGGGYRAVRTVGKVTVLEKASVPATPPAASPDA